MAAATAPRDGCGVETAVGDGCSGDSVRRWMRRWRRRQRLEMDAAVGVRRWMRRRQCLEMDAAAGDGCGGDGDGIRRWMQRRREMDAAATAAGDGCSGDGRAMLL
uniref:Uncharacterized protein n=1 Tax=Oryza rufipogon TaxID=4529 RepID=A0A0E0PN88_ORYRU